MKEYISINAPTDKLTQIFMIKPDGVSRRLDDEIREKLRNSGFTVLSEKKKALSVDEIKLLYKTSFERDYPLGADDPRTEKHIEYLKVGPCIALLVRHKSITKPKLYGYSLSVRGEHWIASECSPSSIRYELRNTEFDNYKPIFSENKYLLNEIPDNIIHTASSDIEFVNAYIVFFQELSLKKKYIPNISKPLSDKKIDLILVATYSMSSSDKMRIKMHCGISHLHAFLSNMGFKVLIKAYATESKSNVALDLISSKPKIIGFSTVSSELRYISDVSDEIRKLSSDIILVGGGPHFTLFPQDIFATNLDAVCVGEGETPLKNLLSGKKFEESGGWFYRDNKKLVINEVYPFIKDLGNLPPVDHTIWDDYLEQKDYSHRRILISRGCPYSCSYCSNKPLSKISKGIYTRFRSPRNIELEIINILDNYPHVECLFLDSEILHPKFANIEGILSVTKKYKNRFYFGTNLRIEVFSHDYLNSLSKAGFEFVNVGLESGSEYIRKHILKRNYSNQDVAEAFEMAKNAGIQVNTYNLVGLPEETPQDFIETIGLNEICRPGKAQISIFFPYPGTDLYYLSLDKGYLSNPFFHHFFKGKERRTPILNMPKFAESKILNCYKQFRTIFN